MTSVAADPTMMLVRTPAFFGTCGAYPDHLPDKPPGLASHGSPGTEYTIGSSASDPFTGMTPV